MRTEAIVIFDIDGVVRDVSQSYRRAIADTVEHFTQNRYRPTMSDIDRLKSEGIWNNDWKGSQELTYRYFEAEGKSRGEIALNYDQIITFFQSRYKGTNPKQFNGYIQTEPLLLEKTYLDDLTAHQIQWGFFSGATRDSAEYVLTTRIGIQNPILVAMEDAPEKPDPTGLLMTVNQMNPQSSAPILYAGDTVADMYTVIKAREQEPSQQWIGVGILPPHVQTDAQRKQEYTETLKTAGASFVLEQITQLTPAWIASSV